METLGAGSGSADAEGTANTSGSAIVGLSLHSGSVAKTFAPGEPIVVRHVRRGNTFMVWAALAVHDDDELLALWLPPGAPCLRPDVRSELPYEQELVERPWRAPGVLQLWPVGAAHAIWVFETSWYVNLQEPFRRTPNGVDTADQLLDLVRTKDGEWRWKDEDELAAAVLQGYLSEDESREIRAEAERVIAANAFPTGWEDWEPDPSWPAPNLPAR
jgi:hypothetical protein